MAVSVNFINELKKNVNQPNVIIEVVLDSGTIKYGYIAGGFSDVVPILKSVASLQNKIDAKSGYATKGQLTFVLSGRDYLKTLIQNNYLKNRRINRKDGFMGLAYSDYVTTFAGKIKDWKRKGDEIEITVADDGYDTKLKIPEENVDKTQYLDYRNTHPVNIMTNILLTQLGINSAYVDSAKFASERDEWLYGMVFNRIITEPKQAMDYLNELQIETNSFILHNGEKITYKVFSPDMPGTTEEWTDNIILDKSLSMDSGYDDKFFNRIVLYYDYDESNNDKEENYESAIIAIDAASQDITQWDEASTKTIKSKWIRTRTWGSPVNITGVVIYHASTGNNAGNGTLTFNYTSNTLQWTAPGGNIGEAVKLSKNGRFQIFDADKAKYIRVIVTTANLPTSNQTDTIAITALYGNTYASVLATKLLTRYRDPIVDLSCEIDINNIVYNSEFIKPTDLKDIISDEVFQKGKSSWNKERCMITSVRPDYASHKIKIEAIQTKMYLRYGFIAPAGYPDYPGATQDQRRYAFIGDTNNKVNLGTEDGYYIW